MLDIFSGLRLVVKRRNINIDNAIFRCHWFFTSTLLISFSLIITARQYVGQPIECHSINKIPDSLLNSYCWVQSTFSVPQSCNNQYVGLDVPYPCIDNTRGRDVKLFAYYQWVGIVLFIQGLLFHLPYYLWKVWENGLIKAITGGLRVAVLNEQERAKKKEIVVEYIHGHLGCHKRYAFKYFVCELICLINLLVQLWATNRFFDGQFIRYGIDVMQYSSSTISSQFGFAAIGGAGNKLSTQQSSIMSNHNANNISDNKQTINTNGITSVTFPDSTQNRIINQQSLLFTNADQTSQQQHQQNRHHQQQQAIMAARQQQRVDPMTYIFPRMTKCTFYDFGSSGDVQKHDALCLLPLNIINEKIYIALWFWFLILALLTLLVIIYRLFAIVSKSVRCKGLISRCKLSNEDDIVDICRHCDVGDWFLFYMVAENLDPLIMREIVASIANMIRDDLQHKGHLKITNDHKSDSGYEKDKQKLLNNELYRRPIKHQASSETTTTSVDLATDEAPSIPSSSRRNSLADQVPLVRKIKKRLYNKRLWSIDLGSRELRQQLFGQQASSIGYRDSHHHEEGRNKELSHVVNMVDLDEQRIGQIDLVPSAPPASEMPIGSAQPVASGVLQRRNNVARMDSSSSSGVSSNESFIMVEMNTNT